MNTYDIAIDHELAIEERHKCIRSDCDSLTISEQSTKLAPRLKNQIHGISTCQEKMNLHYSMPSFSYIKSSTSVSYLSFQPESGTIQRFAQFLIVIFQVSTIERYNIF